MKPPKVFISYSWDSEAHQNWVRQLADELIKKGVAVTLDQYELTLGKNLSHFMERAVTDADKVLLILTENYKLKAEGRQGGVGYEFSIINSEWYRQQVNNTKFMPILRGKDAAASMPVFVNAFVYLNMQDDSQFDTQLEELLRTIYQQPKKVKPPLGQRPIFSTESSTATPSTSSQIDETRPRIGKTEQRIQEKRLAQQQAKQKKEQANLIRRLIGNNELKKAITTLQEIATTQNNTALEKELTLQSAQYNSYLREKRMGLLSSAEQDLRFAKINQAVLELIDFLSDISEF